MIRLRARKAGENKQENQNGKKTNWSEKYE